MRNELQPKDHARQLYSITIFYTWSERSMYRTSLLYFFHGLGERMQCSWLMYPCAIAMPVKQVKG